MSWEFIFEHWGILGLMIVICGSLIWFLIEKITEHHFNKSVKSHETKLDIKKKRITDEYEKCQEILQMITAIQQMSYSLFPLVLNYSTIYSSLNSLELFQMYLEKVTSFERTYEMNKHLINVKINEEISQMITNYFALARYFDIYRVQYPNEKMDDSTADWVYGKCLSETQKLKEYVNIKINLYFEEVIKT